MANRMRMLAILDFGHHVSREKLILVKGMLGPRHSLVSVKKEVREEKRWSIYGKIWAAC